MNDDAKIEDLKQFIVATISQTEARLDGKIETLDQKIETLGSDMQEGFAGVGEAIEEIHVQMEKRLTKLEQEAA
jgi:hypothetical protein